MKLKLSKEVERLIKEFHGPSNNNPGWEEECIHNILEAQIREHGPRCCCDGKWLKFLGISERKDSTS